MDNNSLKIISHAPVPVIKLTTQGYMPRFTPSAGFPGGGAGAGAGVGAGAVGAGGLAPGEALGR